ncbi:carbohydrate ABC transporter permease [Paenibacillus sp. strain BS8-2]
MKKQYVPYLMILPFFTIYILFQLYPIVFSFFVSFTGWNGIGEKTYVGLGNYQRLLQDRLFYKSVGNTLLIMVFTIPLQVITGIFLAAFLKDFTNKLRSSLQLFNFLPYLTTPVAVGMLFQIMFEWKYGSINGILSKIGIIETPINWLGEELGARVVIVLLTFWSAYGYMMVMFLTGLSTIPNSLYEAAKVDGASWFKSFRVITVPLLRPIMTFVVTMSIIANLKLFDEPKVLFTADSTQSIPLGGPDRSVLTIVMNFYDTTFSQFQFGYGSSMAFGLFVLIFIFSLFTMRIMNRGDYNAR